MPPPSSSDGRSVVVLPPLLSEPQKGQQHTDHTDNNNNTSAPRVQMTLDVKARTLGYQLPHAEAEIQRIEELQRAKRDEFLKRRQCRPLERSTHLAQWLERHADSSLQDLALAHASVPVRAVLVPTVENATQRSTRASFADDVIGKKMTMEELFAAEDPGAHHENIGSKEHHRFSVSGIESEKLSRSDRDGIGVSRYQVRGDLKEWLTQVEALNERLVLDAGDFSKHEESLIHTALERQVSLAVHKNAVRDEFLMKQSLKSISEMLENMTRTPFALRDEHPVKDQLESLEKQVQDLYSKVMKRGGFIFGSQVAGSVEGNKESKKVESEGEIRKRQLAVGVAAAAQSQHILLTQVQLDQVLNAFYQQQLPSNKRERGRLERQLVESMVREDNITTSLRRRNKELSEELLTMQETIQQLLEERQSLKKQCQQSLVPTPTSQGGQVGDLQQTNEVIQGMAEVLAKKSLREIQAVCDEAQRNRDEFQKMHEEAQEQLRSTILERDELRVKVETVEAEFRKQEEAKRIQEEERKRLFGGMRSDQQYYQSTIHKVLMQSGIAIAELSMVCRTHADPKNEQRLTQAVSRCLDQWLSELSFAFHFCDTARSHVSETRSSFSPEAIAKKTSQGCDADEINRQLVNDLAQRLDDTIAEAKAKFREARYMRSFLWYLIHCFDAMLNGTYNDEIHGKRKFATHASREKDKNGSSRGVSVLESQEDEEIAGSVEEPFPPESVIALDSDYAYAWSEESNALERVFMGLRARLGIAENQQGEVNTAVLRALESVSMAASERDRSSISVVAPPAARTVTLVSGPPVTDTPNEKEGSRSPPPPQSVSQDAVKDMVAKIAALPVADTKDIRLVQALEDHQRLPQGARAVDVATVLLLQIKEAKGHFSGEGHKASATL